MPRTKPLPPRQREICQRVVEFRDARGITRVALAKNIGLNQFSLANIERGDAPLRFVAGYNFCLDFNRSLRWLATGRLPRSPFTPASSIILSKIGHRSLFSEAYDKHLAKFVEARLVEIAAEASVPVEKLDDGRLVIDRRRLGISQAESHFETTLDLLRERASEMQDDRKISFANQLANVVFQFWNVTGNLESPANPGENILIDSLKSKSGAGRSEIESLIERVRAAASQPGAKTELARLLDVAPARVSEWLSGKKEPGGEYALRLLRWVQERERRKQ